MSFTLLQEQLRSVLDTLSEREAGVVSMRFGLTDGEPKTLDVIGKVYVGERHLVAVMGEYTRHYNTHRRSAVGINDHRKRCRSASRRPIHGCGAGRSSQG